jgi:hypothetical protein
MNQRNFTRLLLLSCMLIGSQAFSQGVGITAGTKPDVSAMLDVSSTNKGLLIPRIALQSVNDAETILNPANSLLLFNTNQTMAGGEGTGYYYNTGTPQFPVWIKLSDNNSTAGWLVGGNSNLTDLAFMGTTDDADVIFERDGIESYRITKGGAILATGDQKNADEGNTGVTPIQGYGRRMMWIPAKSAFRAGCSMNDKWDDVNIGNFSAAMGIGTKASGASSTAMGEYTTASGNSSTAIGQSTTAFGNYSTAMGYYTTASGSMSTTMGEGTSSNVRGGLAIGRYNVQSIANPNVASPTDKVFIIGNGLWDEGLHDAFFVRRNGNAELAGMLKQGSDIRLKKDVAPLEGVISKIANIQPITYNFINTQTHPGEHQIGFSAQEVQKQFPELVSENEQGYLSVSYTNMTAVAIQAIKEQQEIIKKLEAKIAQLEKKMEKY